MKTAVIFPLMALCMTVCSAADSQSRFSYGYAHTGDAVTNEARAAAIDRLNSESSAIAERLLGQEICEGLKLKVRWSDGNTNGFETWFECWSSLKFAIGKERIGALHKALGSRYEDLLSGAKPGQKVQPLADFLAKYGEKR